MSFFLVVSLTYSLCNVLYVQEPDATPEKRAREYGKYPQQTQFGFRIVGMRFYDPGHVDADSKGFCYFQKPYGRALTTRDKLLQAFRLFFSACAEQQNGQTQQSPTKRLSQSRIENDVFSSNAMDGANINGDEQSESHKNDQDHIEQKPQQEQHHPLRPTSNSAAAAIRNRTISNLLVQLRPLRHWFEDNKSLCFYASSLLIVYEGDSDVNVDNMAMIKMIDFGRVRRQAGGDSGYCSGLSMLKSILTDLWQEEEEERIRGSTLKNRQLQQQLHEGE